jgi:hypothetical protein
MVNGEFLDSEEIQTRMKRIFDMGICHPRGDANCRAIEKRCGVACSRSNPTKREERASYVILLT